MIDREDGKPTALCNICETTFDGDYDPNDFPDLISSLKREGWWIIRDFAWMHFCPDCVASARAACKDSSPTRVDSGGCVSNRLVAEANGEVTE